RPYRSTPFPYTTLFRSNMETEADYAWVYFSLSAPGFQLRKDIYINGMFNNYAKLPENKMEYNEATGLYEKAIIIKQGFTNYQYRSEEHTSELQSRENLV